MPAVSFAEVGNEPKDANETWLRYTPTDRIAGEVPGLEGWKGPLYLLNREGADQASSVHDDYSALMPKPTNRPSTVHIIFAPDRTPQEQAERIAKEKAYFTKKDGVPPKIVIHFIDKKPRHEVGASERPQKYAHEIADSFLGPTANPALRREVNDEIDEMGAAEELSGAQAESRYVYGKQRPEGLGQPEKGVAGWARRNWARLNHPAVSDKAGVYFALGAGLIVGLDGELTLNNAHVLGSRIGQGTVAANVGYEYGYNKNQEEINQGIAHLGVVPRWPGFIKRWADKMGLKLPGYPKFIADKVARFDQGINQKIKTSVPSQYAKGFGINWGLMSVGRPDAYQLGMALAGAAKKVSGAMSALYGVVGLVDITNYVLAERGMDTRVMRGEISRAEKRNKLRIYAKGESLAAVAGTTGNIPVAAAGLAFSWGCYLYEFVKGLRSKPRTDVHLVVDGKVEKNEPDLYELFAAVRQAMDITGRNPAHVVSKLNELRKPCPVGALASEL